MLLVGALTAVIGISGHFMIGQAAGQVTEVKDTDGRERTVHWRGYPGMAGVDVQETLSGPTPEEGFAAGQSIIAEIRAGLTREFQLQWVPVPNEKTAEAFTGRSQNYFGGESLLTGVNSPPSQSTSVPRAWADKQHAIEVIGDVSARYGYTSPAIDTYDGWSEEDRVRELGGATPETRVLVSGVAQGPAGQWLRFEFLDLSHDTDGRFRERFTQDEGVGPTAGYVSISYGANGLLPEEDREEFRERFEPFKGLTPPEPLQS